VLTDRYINFFTDFGFKKLFGEEPNKDLLISLLNTLLKGEAHIEDLTYLNGERLGRSSEERKAVYDLYCTTQSGEKIIVEVQRVKQRFFKDRSVYYSSFAVQDQASKGKEWLYELKAVYTIAIMDFMFDEDKHKLMHRVKLMEVDTKSIFYDKLTLIYLEIPKFNKSLSQLDTDYDRWMYAFKNLHTVRHKPEELRTGVFLKLMELAEIVKMNTQEQRVYQESLKAYRDFRGAIETAKEDGQFERATQMAKKMLIAEEPLDKIVLYTGLSIEEAEKIQQEL
jgi:predicted transposase/invertase (TIGR01784 family)